MKSSHTHSKNIHIFNCHGYDFRAQTSLNLRRKERKNTTTDVKFERMDKLMYVLMNSFIPINNNIIQEKRPKENS
jgi:hypothetical protein